MKLYKDEKYKDIIRLMYPVPDSDKFYGIPYHYDDFDKRWIRSGLGMAIPFYTLDKIKELEYIGDTSKDYDFYTDGDIDSSYIIKVSSKRDCGKPQ